MATKDKFQQPARNLKGVEGRATTPCHVRYLRNTEYLIVLGDASLRGNFGRRDNGFSILGSSRARGTRGAPRSSENSLNCQLRRKRRFFADAA